MKISKIQIKHPIFNRNITVIMIDNKIDNDSLEYLVYAARYGGHRGGIIGIKTHKIIADRIAELYFHLKNKFDLKWNQVSEIHLEMLRNMMVGESKDKLINPRTKKIKEPIIHQTCDNKMQTWFNFYLYMKEKNKCDIILNYREKEVRNFYRSMNHHLNIRLGNNNNKVKVWNLFFNKRKRSNRKYALTKQEFNEVCRRLGEIDLVYEIMALFAVETALRIDAIMKIDENEFNGYFKVAHSQSKKVSREYLAKYNKVLCYEMSIEFFGTMKMRYLTRELTDRLEKHYSYCKNKTKQTYSENAFWIKKNGKRVTENDFRKALEKVSKDLGRIEEKKITPHIFRHTAATWKVIEICRLSGLDLRNTGYRPPHIINLVLQRLLGHNDDKTSLIYIATALDMMEVEVKDSIIRMPKRLFLNNPHVQNIMLENAKEELKEKYNENTFNLLDFCIKNGSVVN